MKIEIEINDINRDEVIERMAARLLGFDYQRDDDPDSPDPTPPLSRWDGKQIGKHLRLYFEGKIKETVDQMVSDAIDQQIRDTIAASVAKIVEEGWQTTDEYGRVTGTRTLKSIVLDSLTRKGGDYNRQTIADKVAEETIRKALHESFGAEIKRAQETFRKEIDNVVAAKLTESIKTALGLR